jgi:hypothetical protein
MTAIHGQFVLQRSTDHRPRGAQSEHETLEPGSGNHLVTGWRAPVSYDRRVDGSIQNCRRSRTICHQSRQNVDRCQPVIETFEKSDKPAVRGVRRRSGIRRIGIKGIGLSGNDDILAEISIHLLVHFKPLLLDLRAVGPEDAILVSSPLIGKISHQV